MKLFLVLLIAGVAAAADWEAIQRIGVNDKIEVTTLDGKRTRGAFISSSGAAVVLRDGSSERAVMRTEIRRVRIYDPSRRVRKGVMWTLIGAAAGAGAGVAACPYCPNEGNTSPYIGLGAGVGAGLGALGFLSNPYRTVYKNK